MSAQRSHIGYPWILHAITNYNGGIFTPKAAPAQVVEFLKMPERSKECQYTGAIVLISDRKYYIRAVITKEAQEALEREDKYFTLGDIKNKIVILKKFTLSFSAEEDLKWCEFYLTIQHFSVLPMETDTVDILNCNMEPDVRKKIHKLWQDYMTDLNEKEAMSDLSDISLTQLLIAASEERLSSLKSVAEQCLDLNQYATQEISAQARTTWSMAMRSNKNHSVHFSVPINLLIIPPEEEAALEQMPELRPNIISTGDADDSLAEENASTPYSTAESTLSQESLEDACSTLSGNPWNNLTSICISGSTGSAALDSNNSVIQESCEKKMDVDSDITPDLQEDYQDRHMSVPIESQGQTPSLLSSGQPSNVIVPEEEINTSTHMTGTSSINLGLNSCQMKCAGSSSASTSLILHAQDLSKDCLSQVYRSPQKIQSVGSKMPISPHLSYSSDSDSDYRLHKNVFSSDRTRKKSSASRIWKAVKRKQSPEDLDASLADQEKNIPVCMEKLDCAADVSTCPSFSIASKSTEVQNEINRPVDKRCRTEKNCLEKEHERRQVGKRTGTEPVKATGTFPSTKKAIPCKPSLDFVGQPKLLTSSTPCKEASTSVLCKQTSTFLEPGLEMKKTKMTHFDGTSFQYKYKTPSADLCAHVKALQIPTEFCAWAKQIISDSKGKVS